MVSRAYENSNEKPRNLVELKVVRITEFLPFNKKSKAQLKLLRFKMRSSLDKQIQYSMNLIRFCETPTGAAYSFFFMSVPQYLKGKLSEEFPESDPSFILNVHKCPWKHEIAEKWANTRQENSKINGDLSKINIQNLRETITPLETLLLIR